MGGRRVKKLIVSVGLASLMLAGCGVANSTDSGVVQEKKCVEDSSYNSTIELEGDKKYYISRKSCRLLKEGAHIKIDYYAENMRITTFEYVKDEKYVPPENK